MRQDHAKILAVIDSYYDWRDVKMGSFYETHDSTTHRTTKRKTVKHIVLRRHTSNFFHTNSHQSLQKIFFV